MDDTMSEGEYQYQMDLCDHAGEPDVKPHRRKYRQGESIKVIVTFEYPPIPARGMDWCAYEDGREEAQDYGWGQTPAQALRDLADVLEERDA